MKVNREEMKLIREELWVALDANQCSAKSEFDLLNLEGYLFDIPDKEVTMMQSLIKRIDKELA